MKIYEVLPVKLFTISFVFSVATLFILIMLDSELSNLYCVWPLQLLEATGLLGNNTDSFYNNWYSFSMTFSLFVQSAVIYFLTSKLAAKN
ncbi:hypothetical protein V6255_13150 [Psychromonas arctica]|uniref:Uncharacterized protein n=1 Tax=Psychromonas arctica TaxID=168275 RepID=A0ABU9HER8_9GAMM